MGTEELLRELAPQVLGALVRRYGHFDAAEDAVQEGLLAAATQWPAEGVPDDPRAWLIRVSSRRLIDQLRSEESRRLREESDFRRDPAATRVAPPADEGAAGDDSLLLLFLCCHPAIAVPAQVALTLRAVGGLTTAEIASAFLVPEPTMGQRISRAKQKIKSSGLGFELPPPAQWAARLDAVLQVLYLIFNEGYTSSSGPELARVELSAEAIRLARMLHRQLPDDGEAAGLLALMLLTDARRPARTGPGGELVPLDEQDRSRWDRTAIAEGVALVSAALSRTRPGAYQLQAAIAAVHDEAPDAKATDWPQVLALYDLLERVSDSPMVRLNKAVAVAMVSGPQAGLDLLATLDGDERVARHHRLAAVRAHLLELAGDTGGAAEEYRAAADRTLSEPEQRYLRDRADRLAAGTP
ncbi:RNA polymerase sigma factor [Asanoa siamensis]|uniref:RNA polymerase sigma24 factor n=1 Tax=Asanoa siamensis TaxID=926357 RepID=A0ABQ4CQD0_9ACTN|nr:sigma-70 family RNA polymerase sigma factor [Asanoa siamensis]GIF73503.1 RNA polymerase sigma24 factor [Asanoa siamensis]